MYALTRTVHSPAFDPFREMDRAFFGRPFGSFFTERSAFPTDITDEGDHYLLRTDLPGFSKEEIRLELQEDLLTIRAERNADTEDQNERFLRRERYRSNYTRSFRLKDIDTEKLHAKYENGVLTVTLPKQQEEKPTTRQVIIE